MPRQSDLFGKTFDQQLNATGGELDGKDIRPNVRVAGEVVFEPLSTGVRVTARDEKHRVMWGFVASQENLGKIHCLVAVYETLYELIARELKKHGLPSKDEEANPIESAKKAITDLRNVLDQLEKSIAVKKVSEATEERARTIRRLLSDANRMIQLELPTGKTDSTAE
jgi:hypothetical protein